MQALCESSRDQLYSSRVIGQRRSGGLESGSRIFGKTSAFFRDKVIKMVRQTVGYSLLLVLLLPLWGCVAGNDVKVDAYRNTTVGQELVDLEIAKEKGLINPVEYEKLRAEILKGGPLNINLEGHDSHSH